MHQQRSPIIPGQFHVLGRLGRHAGYDVPAYPGGTWMGSLMDYLAKQQAVRTCPSAPLRKLPAPA